MTYILGLAGRKQAGKDTSANFLIRNKNELFGKDVRHVDDYDGEEIYKTYEYDVIKLSFADKLKQICMDLFGLTYEQCYGTDEQKNSLTQLRWEDLPNYPYVLRAIDEEVRREFNINTYSHLVAMTTELDKRTPKGFMTARQVLQQFGTGVCRRMLFNVWVDAAIREINKANPFLAIVADVRFPNEVEGIQKAGGKVVKLTRCVFPEDTHESEVALDSNRYDWKKFDAVIANDNMTVDEQNKSLVQILKEFQWLKK